MLMIRFVRDAPVLVQVVMMLLVVLLVLMDYS